ncbi:hypothetical protein CEXT_500061 [Caerostris extrusa]|uniref:Uncharacterized protein n=1 Tax=Caerostris extrusa TaxID=172846 RepID=A0AAV4YAW4_CAEEX|nr:hypothetical protein CEXT_500061 [Caerostris extrusa]
MCGGQTKLNLLTHILYRLTDGDSKTSRGFASILWDREKSDANGALMCWWALRLLILLTLGILYRWTDGTLEQVKGMALRFSGPRKYDVYGSDVLMGH